MARFEELTRGDWRNISAAVIMLAVLMALVGYSLLLLEVPWGLFVLVVVLGVLGGVFLLTLVLAQLYGRGYRCPECGHVFEVSTRGFIFSYSHGFKLGLDTKRLRCPECGKKSFKTWMKRVG